MNPPPPPGGERASWVPGGARRAGQGKPAAATLGLGSEGRAGPWRTGHDPRHPPHDAPPASSPSALGAGRGTRRVRGGEAAGRWAPGLDAAQDKGGGGAPAGRARATGRRGGRRPQAPREAGRDGRGRSPGPRGPGDGAGRARFASGRREREPPPTPLGTRGGSTKRARRQGLPPVMILPQVHLRKPCYDFYFL